MTEYNLLELAELHCHTIEIVENSTGKTGVANTEGNKVAVFYGADDGSDDEVVTPEEFNNRFAVTCCLRGYKV